MLSTAAWGVTGGSCDEDDVLSAEQVRNRQQYLEATVACQESEAACKFTVAACNNSAAAVIRESASACRALAVEVACGGISSSGSDGSS